MADGGIPVEMTTDRTLARISTALRSKRILAVGLAAVMLASAGYLGVGGATAGEVTTDGAANASMSNGNMSAMADSGIVNEA